MKLSKHTFAIVFVLLAALIGRPVRAAGWQTQRQKNQALIAAIKTGDTSQILEALAAGASGAARESHNPQAFKQALAYIRQRKMSPSGYGEAHGDTEDFDAFGMPRWTKAKHLSALLLFCDYCVNSMNQAYLQRRIDDLGPDIRVVRALLDHGARIDERDVVGETPLHKAVCFPDADVCELLIQRGADVNAREGFGFTPLYRAVDYPNVVKVLLAHGANINARSARGHGRVTPLMYAAGDDDIDLVRMLIEHGANASARDEVGKTAIYYAHLDAPKMIALLRKYGAK